MASVQADEFLRQRTRTLELLNKQTLILRNAFLILRDNRRTHEQRTPDVIEKLGSANTLIADAITTLYAAIKQPTYDNAMQALIKIQNITFPIEGALTLYQVSIKQHLDRTINAIRPIESTLIGLLEMAPSEEVNAALTIAHALIAKINAHLADEERWFAQTEHKTAKQTLYYVAERLSNIDENIESYRKRISPHKEALIPEILQKVHTQVSTFHKEQRQNITLLRQAIIVTEEFIKDFIEETHTLVEELTRLIESYETTTI